MYIRQVKRCEKTKILCTNSSANKNNLRELEGGGMDKNNKLK